MKKHINAKKVYLFTFISFILTILFLCFFAETAPRFYTGFDKNTSPNTLSQIADFIFIFLLSINFIGIILCIVYTAKILFNKISKQS